MGFVISATIAITNNYYPIAPLYFALGDSMYPTIIQYDLVLVIPRPLFDRINVGDIIVYRSGDYFIIHRVIHIEGGMLVTKGDNVPYTDPPIYTSQVWGKVATVNGVPIKMNIFALLFFAIGLALLYRAATKKR